MREITETTRLAFGASEESPGSPVSVRTLANIRWVALAGQLAALLFVRYGLGYALPLELCLAVVALSAALNVFVTASRGAGDRLDERQAALFLAFDITQLSVLLYLTGGLANPFALLVLAPVTVSASILSLTSTVRLCLVALVAATVLLVWHRPLPWGEGGLVLPTIYLAGLWTAIVTALVFIAAYTWRVAAEARDMAEALAATQLALSREQQLSAVGGLAAAAAHELGTPLSTIAVVATELARDLPADSEWAEDVALLRSESARCREILGRISRGEEVTGAAAVAQAPFTVVVEEAAAPHAREGIEVIIERHGPEGARLSGLDGESEDFEAEAEGEPTVARSPEFLHAIGTLVQNSVQFAAATVEITVYWDGETCSVIIEDDGPGFPVALLGRLGEPYLSTRTGRDGHMGLGLFIARTLLGRIGGDLMLGNRDEGGARVVVRWPRSRLEAL